MKQTLQPLGDRVLVLRDESKNETASGILLPDAAKEKPQQGRVINSGEDATKVHNGDIVMLPKYGGVEVELDGGTHVLIAEADILGILRAVEEDAEDTALLDANNPPPGAMPRTVSDDDLDEPLGAPQVCTDEVCESCQ